jgi:hypothetical protein
MALKAAFCEGCSLKRHTSSMESAEPTRPSQSRQTEPGNGTGRQRFYIGSARKPRNYCYVQSEKTIEGVPVYRDETKGLDLFKEGQYWFASSMSTGVQHRFRSSEDPRVGGSHPWDQWTKRSVWEPFGEWLTTADVQSTDHGADFRRDPVQIGERRDACTQSNHLPTRPWVPFESWLTTASATDADHATSTQRHLKQRHASSKESAEPTRPSQSRQTEPGNGTGRQRFYIGSTKKPRKYCYVQSEKTIEGVPVYRDETNGLDLFKGGRYWFASSMSTGVQHRFRTLEDPRVGGSHPWDQWTK